MRIPISLCNYFLLALAIAIGCEKRTTEVKRCDALDGTWTVYNMGEPKELIGYVQINSGTKTFASQSGTNKCTGVLGIGLHPDWVLETSPVRDSISGTISVVTSDFSVDGYWSKIETNKAIVFGLDDPNALPGHPTQFIGEGTDLLLIRREEERGQEQERR